MTDKTRRQRGSRTHGGGSQKNRRGAGNRGGRGRAGRDKHEFHDYEPLGKYGFDRPQKVQREVETINVGELDEETTLSEQGLSPTLRLHPPRGGHDGIKHPTGEGGQLGRHDTDDIDDLLEAMR